MSDEKSNPVSNPDPSPKGTAVVQPDLGAAISAAGNAALQQHAIENPAKRKIGRPRKNPVSVGGLGNGSDPAPLAGDPSNFVPVEFSPPQPPIDEETVKALAEGLAGLLEDLGSGWLRSQVLKATRDVHLADEAAKGGKMSDSTRKMIVFGTVQCARKYLDSIEYAPEVALGGGLALYGFGVWSQARTFAAKLNEMRASVPPAA